MESVQQQVNAVVEEIALLKGEIIGIKMQHASFHQSSVDKSTADEARFVEAAKKVDSELAREIMNRIDPDNVPTSRHIRLVFYAAQHHHSFKAHKK